jgi:hypothetical protein
MATTFYSDRAFVTINGTEKANLKSVKWTIDDAVTRVDTMSRDHRSVGWKKGNRKITGSMELDVPDTKAEIDLSFLYGQPVDIVCTLGSSGERWTLRGLVQTTQDYSGSVGEASKTINFEALDAINESGAAVNAIVGF